MRFISHTGVNHPDAKSCPDTLFYKIIELNAPDGDKNSPTYDPGSYMIEGVAMLIDISAEEAVKACREHFRRSDISFSFFDQDEDHTLAIVKAGDMDKDDMKALDRDEKYETGSKPSAIRNSVRNADNIDNNSRFKFLDLTGIQRNKKGGDTESLARECPNSIVYRLETALGTAKSEDKYDLKGHAYIKSDPSVLQDLHDACVEHFKVLPHRIRLATDLSVGPMAHVSIYAPKLDEGALNALKSRDDPGEPNWYKEFEFRCLGANSDSGPRYGDGLAKEMALSKPNVIAYIYPESGCTAGCYVWTAMTDQTVLKSLLSEHFNCPKGLISIDIEAIGGGMNLIWARCKRCDKSVFDVDAYDMTRSSASRSEDKSEEPAIAGFAHCNAMDLEADIKALAGNAFGYGLYYMEFEDDGRDTCGIRGYAYVDPDRAIDGYRVIRDHFGDNTGVIEAYRDEKTVLLEFRNRNCPNHVPHFDLNYDSLRRLKFPTAREAYGDMMAKLAIPVDVIEDYLRDYGSERVLGYCMPAVRDLSDSKKSQDAVARLAIAIQMLIVAYNMDIDDIQRLIEGKLPAVKTAKRLKGKTFTFRIGFRVPGDDESEARFCARCLTEAQDMFRDWVFRKYSLDSHKINPKIQVVYDEKDAERYGADYGTPEEYYGTR